MKKIVVTLSFAVVALAFWLPLSDGSVCRFNTSKPIFPAMGQMLCVMPI